jgi:hypothetical protein
MKAVRQAVVVGSTLVILGIEARFQEPTRIPLRPADASLSEDFSRLISVRELPDGRLLLSDNRENRIVIADFRANAVTSVGRVGSGPSEFRRAGPLIELEGDSTLLADPGNGRWLILSGTRIVATLPGDDRVVAMAPVPAGADRAGHVLAQRFEVAAKGRPDSMVLVRVSRALDRADTIAKLRTPSMRVSPTVKSLETRISVQRITVSNWSAGEQAILFRDGWVAIARLDPYRVEWQLPDGRQVKGPSLPFKPTPFDEHEKRAHLEGLAKSTGRAAPASDSRDDWPDEIPPFSSVSTVLGEPSPALLASPDGRLFVHRMNTASAPETRYDVIGRDGRLQGQLVLDPNQRILGFGEKHLYLAVADDDGIQRVRRHPWP